MSRVWKAYQYLFYKFYTWNLCLNRGKDSFAYKSGWFILSLLDWFIFISVLGFIEIVTGYGFDQLAKLPTLKIVAIATIFLMVNHYIFIRENKYKEIIKKFENEDKKSKFKGNIFAWSCIIFTLLLFISSAFLLRYMRPPEDSLNSSVSVSSQNQTVNSGEEEMMESARNIQSQNNSDNDKLYLPGISKN